MKRKLWLFGAIAAIAAVGVAGSFRARAADHLDAPGATAAPEADITDTYSWMDGNNVVLVMDVTPLATTMSKFSDKVQYVLHTESHAAFGMPGTTKDIICTFTTDQKISCWIGKDDYVNGDPSATSGITSDSGKVKVFAGLRDDPFFFNLDGFKDTVATVDSVETTLMYDTAGCPAVDAATSSVLVNKLKTDPNSTPPGGTAKDFFAGKNVLSIVLSIDKSLLTKDGPIVSVWGSTNKGA